MITEKEISQQLKREVKSPLRVGSLADLDIDIDEFLRAFRPFFSELTDDQYAVRQKQMAFLVNAFEEDKEDIQQLHKPYFEGDIELSAFQHWIDKFDSEQRIIFQESSLVTRQRNISSFDVDASNNDFKITRVVDKGFEQNVDDFRVWKRVFTQASPECVENKLFYTLLKGTAKLIQSIHPKAKRFKITSHFMRTIAYKGVDGENSPEGIHEDGAQYIISALVIDRQNIFGAESEVYEQLHGGHRDLIFSKILAPGEFIFQADTGEEKTFGNDLWHYVTPIEPIDKSKVGTRDIIGFDIDILA